MPYTIEPPQPDAAPTQKAASPYTIEPPSPEPSAPSALSRIAHGFEAPFVGMDVLASQAEQYIPGIPKETAAKDLALAQQEKAAFEKQGTPGFSGYELIGGMLNPMNYLGGPLSVRGAGVLPTLGRAAQQGAVTAAIQPEHGPSEIAAGAIGGTAVAGITEPIVRALSGNTTAGLDKFIKETFTSAIKPGVGGKFPLSQEQRYQDQVGNAVISILDNKANLQLKDDMGNVRVGELPQSLDDFSQAIDQTKRKIFQEYDARAKAAGQAFGGRNMVSLAPVVGELYGVANSTAVQDLSPEVARTALEMANRFSARGSYTTQEAQDAIQHANEMLKGFYNRKPTHEVVGSNGLEALVAHKLREGLDAAVERASGPGYQDLKNQYGALSKLETDVVRRAIVVGRQEPGRGLMGRIGDVVSAHDVIHGIMTFNPAAVATGAGIRAFTGEMRRLRSPNRAVKRIFEAAEKRSTLQPDPMRDALLSGARRVAPVAGALTADQMLGTMAP